MADMSVYLAIAVVWITAIFCIRRQRRACTVPGPKGWPIIGIYPSLRHAVFKDFAELGKKYGDIFSCRIATADVVVANTYDIIDDLFRKRKAIFSNRFISLSDDLDIPIGFGEIHAGKKWEELRNSTVGILNNQNLGDRTFQDLLNDEVSRFYNHVNETYKGEAFFPKGALLHCMSNIILSLTFRRRLDYTDEKMKELIKASHELPECVDPKWYFGVPTVIQMMARFNILPIKKFRNSQLALYRIVDECYPAIAAHERGKKFDESMARDFVDVYLSMGDAKVAEGKHTYLTENTMRGVASNIFAAGLESTATMLLWSVLLLTKYPDVQKKLRKEVDAVIGRERLPTLKDRDSMPYAKAVLQETHRFASVSPLGAFHVAAKDSEYKGYFIPKGTYVIGNLWAMHHDERVFPEPFSYNPERFMNEAGEFVKCKYVAPYGIGKRTCPGEVLAQRELFLFITQMVQRFELLPEKGKSTESMLEEGVYNGVGVFTPEFKTRFIPIKQN